MVFAIIMLFCSATLVGAFYYSFLSAGKAKKQILLGVTLPKEVLEGEEMRKLAATYQKKINRCTLWLILAGIPVHAAMAGYISVFFVLYLVWGTLTYLAPLRILKREHQRLYQLKQENHWTVGETKTVYIDTQASGLAAKYPLSAFHFLLSALICLLPLYVSESVSEFFQEDMAVIVFVTSLATKLCFFLLYRWFFHGGNKVYSKETKINQKISGLKRNIMGNCFVFLSYLDSISFVILEWGMGKGNSVGGFRERMIAFSFVQMMEIFWLLYCIYQMEKRKNEILKADRTPIVVDEDEYWKGMYYENPKDKRLLVADRVFESNMTFNMAHPAGKLIVYGLTAFTAVGMLWLSMVLLRMDFVPFGMDIGEEQIAFTAGSYNMVIPMEEIEQVSLRNGLPEKRLIKLNGGATDGYLLGKFRMEDLGNCSMYVYRNYPVMIQIDTKESVIFFNTKEETRTEELYEALCQAVERHGDNQVGESSEKR